MTTHTLILTIPLEVAHAQPGRIEAHRPEGLGGLIAVAAGLEAAVKALVKAHAPDVSVVGMAAHAIEGDGTALARALAAAAGAP